MLSNVGNNKAEWRKEDVMFVWLSYMLLSLASPQIPSTPPLLFHYCGPLSFMTALLREDASIMTAESSNKSSNYVEHIGVMKRESIF